MSTLAISPVNVALFRDVLDQIDLRPHLFDSTHWRRQLATGEVAYNLAGWTVVVSGAAFLRLPSGSLSTVQVVPPGGGDPEPVWEYATRVLGLGHTIPDGCTYPELFWSLTSLEDVRRITGQLITAGGAR